MTGCANNVSGIPAVERDSSPKVTLVPMDALLTNTRSQHVLEKVGFRELRRDNAFVYYRIDRTGFDCAVTITKSGQRSFLWPLRSLRRKSRVLIGMGKPQQYADHSIDVWIPPDHDG